MKLVIGLGNPGEKYDHTRHNLGFMVLDEFLKKMDDGKWKIGVETGKWKIENKVKSEIIKSPEITLVKPLTFMNNSGLAVSLIVNYFKINSEELIIIHDDLDLKLGKIKVRLGGAAAGHHGVESIISALGTDKFIRVRLGIGNLQSHSGEHKRIHFNAEKFVVEPFMSNEKSTVKKMLKNAISALELLLDKGLEEAQNQYN